MDQNDIHLYIIPNDVEHLHKGRDLQPLSGGHCILVVYVSRKFTMCETFVFE